MPPDRWTGRGSAAGRKLLARAGCVAAASSVAAGVGSASSPRGTIPAHPAAVQSVAVGPQGSPSGEAARVSAAAGGASQIISGVATSTSAVRFSGARPAYSGTEPGTMTLVRRGRELIVTVVPR